MEDVVFLRENLNGGLLGCLLGRARAISQSISGWMKEDEDAATSYVNESTLLTDEQKERVIQRASQGGGGRRRR